MVIPYLKTPQATYAVLFALLAMHLTFNYLAVRGVAMRALNRQRAQIAWDLWTERQLRAAPAPEEVAKHEWLFVNPTAIVDEGGRCRGMCSFAVASSDLAVPRVKGSTLPVSLEVVEREKYVFLWKERRQGKTAHSWHPLLWCAEPLVIVASQHHVTIALKRGYSVHDALKAWLHVLQAVRGRAGDGFQPTVSKPVDDGGVIEFRQLFERFSRQMQEAGWRMEDGLLLTGTPRAVDVEEISGSQSGAIEDKKTI
jgi:hypothetical protein